MLWLFCVVLSTTTMCNDLALLGAIENNLESENTQSSSFWTLGVAI